MRKMMNSVRALATAGVLLLAAAPAQAKVRIQHMAYTGHGQAYVDFLNDRKAAFEASRADVEVDIAPAALAPTDYAAKILVMVAGGSPPDVTDAYPAIGGELIAGGVLADLRPWMERDPALQSKAFLPVALQFYRGARGEIFGMPYGVLPLATTFNEELFDARGVPAPNSPGTAWTWESAVQAGKKLTQDTDGNGTPNAWGLSARPDILRVWNFVHQAGGNFFDRALLPTESRFTSTQVAAGVQFWADLYNVHRIAGPDNGVYQGTVAFTFDEGPWAVGNMATSKAPFAWGVGRLPRGPANSAGIVFGGGYQVIKSGKNTAAAWEWVKFLSTKESQLAFARFTGRIPALISAAREYTTLFPKAPASITLYLAIAQDPQALPEPVSPVLNAVRGRFGQGIATVRDGKRPVQEFLVEMDAFSKAELRAASQQK